MAARLSRLIGVSFAVLSLAGGLGALEALAQAVGVAGLRPADPNLADPFADPSLAPSDPGAPTPAPTRKPKYPAAAALAPYPGAQRLGQRGGPPAPEPTVIPGPSVAALAAANARRRAPEDDPYAPLGVMAGDLRLTPYVEENIGYADNPGASSAGSKGSETSQTEVGVSLQSLWSRDDLHGALRAGYTDYLTDHAANAPYGSGNLAGRIDVTRDLSLDAEGRFSLSAETTSSLGLTGRTIISSTPLLATYGATFGGTDRFGLFSLALHGSIDRTAYQNAHLSDGTTDNLSSDNFTDYGVTLRGSYAASPAFSPFLQAAYDSRRYDFAVDANGYRRNSTGYALTAGATVEFTRLLTGEVSAGYSARKYADPRLAGAAGPLVAASLVWTPTPLTTVTLNASAAVTDSTVAGASATMTRSYSLDVAHRLLRNFLVGANASYATDKFYGIAQSDSTKTFGARVEYDIGREIVLKAAASRSLFNSSVAGANYAADVFTLGLRVQR